MTEPFSLSDDEAYARWRDQKLARFPAKAEDLIVEIGDLSDLTKTETDALHDCVQRTNMAVYKGSAHQDVRLAKIQVQALGARFGLKHLDQNPYADEDAITPIHVSDTHGRKLYVPYTQKAINWHTDGYYNPLDRTIRAMILHCVRPAGVAGGENHLFDPEIAYILMRDHDPDMIRALSRATVLKIPGNDVDDQVDRDDICGPVFSVDKSSGALLMRYTQRKRNVVWADDELTHKALAFLQNVLEGPYAFAYRLKAGEGLICNNVLHTRTAFEDGETLSQKRLMLRARFWEHLVL